MSRRREGAKERRERRLRAVRIASLTVCGDGSRTLTPTPSRRQPPVIELVAPAPTVFQATPALVTEYVALATVVSDAATAPVIEFVAPAPAIAYTAPFSLIVPWHLHLPTSMQHQRVRSSTWHTHWTDARTHCTFTCKGRCHRCWPMPSSLSVQPWSG